MDTSRRDMDQPFLPTATFVLEKSANRGDLLGNIDKIPEFRNRNRGHSFSLSEQRAQELYEQWEPIITDILNASFFLARDLQYHYTRNEYKFPRRHCHQRMHNRPGGLASPGRSLHGVEHIANRLTRSAVFHRPPPPFANTAPSVADFVIPDTGSGGTSPSRWPP